MLVLKNDNIDLRALEPSDLDFLYAIENDGDYWEVSSTQTPFSKYILKKYLANAHQDIYEAKQLRLVIENNKTNKTIGLVDLFDFNPQHQRAGIGILVAKEHQNKGYAFQALQIFIEYAFTKLNLHQLYANIPGDNVQSMALFKKLQFHKIGIQKDWVLSDDNFKDVHLYQKINIS